MTNQILYRDEHRLRADIVEIGRRIHRQGLTVALKSYTLYTPSVSAGDVVELSLVWQGLAKLNHRYKVFTHLLDPADHIVGQRDAEPLAGTRPTPTWKPAEVITDRYGLPVMAGTPPGSYRLEIGLYDAERGATGPSIIPSNPQW